MSATSVLEVAIGLILIFWIFAMATSGINEFISARLNLRGKYLLKGLRAMLSNEPSPGGAATAEGLQAAVAATATPVPADLAAVVLTHPLVAGAAQPVATGEAAASPNRAPSYISSRNFARALVDAIVPDTDGQTTVSQIRETANLIDGPIGPAIRSLTAGVGDDIEALRLGVEQWYDDQMQRVSGWYKRRVKSFMLIIAGVIALVANVDVISISQNLYNDPGTRAILVEQAGRAVPCETSDLDCVKAAVVQLPTQTLGLFWSQDPPDCRETAADCNILEQHGMSDLWAIAVKLIGLAIGWQAIALGAPFWFDLLGKLTQLRSTGPRPDPAAT